MKRFISMVLMICLLAVTFTYEAEAGERVIYSFQQLGENSGRITLSFQDKNIKDNIQITGYSIVNNNRKMIKVSYVSGKEAKTNYNSTYINQLEFPLKIFLEEGNSNAVKITDLPTDTQLRNHILHLYDRGIINGRPDGSFGAEENISRAEVATLITLAANYTISRNLSSPFPDVKADYWATKYILPLSQRGILVGNEKGQFMPNEYITIGAIIRIIDATFHIQLDPQPLFETDQGTWGWSGTYYSSLMKQGLLLKTDAYVLPYKPNKYATRGEVATLISRALENLHTIEQ